MADFRKFLNSLKEETHPKPKTSMTRTGSGIGSYARGGQVRQRFSGGGTPEKQEEEMKKGFSSGHCTIGSCDRPAGHQGPCGTIQVNRPRSPQNNPFNFNSNVTSSYRERPISPKIQKKIPFKLTSTETEEEADRRIKKALENLKLSQQSSSGQQNQGIFSLLENPVGNVRGQKGKLTTRKHNLVGKGNNPFGTCAINALDSLLPHVDLNPHILGLLDKENESLKTKYPDEGDRRMATLVNVANTLNTHNLGESGELTSLGMKNGFGKKKVPVTKTESKIGFRLDGGNSIRDLLNVYGVKNKRIEDPNEGVKDTNTGSFLNPTPIPHLIYEALKPGESGSPKAAALHMIYGNHPDPSEGGSHTEVIDYGHKYDVPNEDLNYSFESLQPAIGQHRLKAKKVEPEVLLTKTGVPYTNLAEGTKTPKVSSNQYSSYKNSKASAAEKGIRWPAEVYSVSLKKDK